MNPQKIQKFLLKNWFSIALALFLAFVLTDYFKQRGKNDRLFTELIGQTQKYEQLSEHAAKSDRDWETNF